MAERTNILPPPKNLKDVLEVCERQVRNIGHNLYDCADCQDCSESELFIYHHQLGEWSQLAGDIRAIIEKEKK